MMGDDEIKKVQDWCKDEEHTFSYCEDCTDQDCDDCPLERRET